MRQHKHKEAPDQILRHNAIAQASSIQNKAHLPKNYVLSIIESRNWTGANEAEIGSASLNRGISTYKNCGPSGLLTLVHGQARTRLRAFWQKEVVYAGLEALSQKSVTYLWRYVWTLSHRQLEPPL